MSPADDGTVPRLVRLIRSDPSTSGVLLADRYEIRRPLGRGGMGEVHEAWDRRLRRTVAVKLLPPDRAGEDAYRVRFVREAQTLAALSHPRIVSVFDFGVEGDLPYLVMEHIPGRDLAELLREERVPRERALEWSRQICDALQYAHERGVVHRDIKPGNVLVAPEGWIKVVDFGVAKLLEPAWTATALTQSGVVVGTPQYMAPEQAAGNSPGDPRSDLYSLGVLLHELLEGRLPSPAHQSREEPVLRQILRRALDPDPSRRYSSAAEFKQALEGIPAASLPPSRRPTWIAAAAGAAVLLVLCAVAWTSRPNDRDRSVGRARPSPRARVRPPAVSSLEKLILREKDIPAGWSLAKRDSAFSGEALPILATGPAEREAFLRTGRAPRGVKPDDFRAVYAAAFRRAGHAEIYLTLLEFRDIDTAERFEKTEVPSPRDRWFRQTSVFRAGNVVAFWGLRSRTFGAFEKFLQVFRPRMGRPSISWETLRPGKSDLILPPLAAREDEAASVADRLGLAVALTREISQAFRGECYRDGTISLLEVPSAPARLEIRRALEKKGRVLDHDRWIALIEAKDPAKLARLEEYVLVKFGRKW